MKLVYKLVFKTEDDNNFTITIPNANIDRKDNISEYMDKLIQYDAIDADGSRLKSKVSACMISTNISNIEVG